MKTILTIFAFLTTQLLSAQYTFTAYGGKVIANSSKKSISAGYQSLQYHTLTDYGLKIETVAYGFGGSISYVKVEEITYSDILKAYEVDKPEIKDAGGGKFYFYLSGNATTGNMVYYTRYLDNHEPEIEKQSSLQVYAAGGKQATQDYLNMLIAKAKEATSQAGYKEDRSIFTAHGVAEQVETDKKVDDVLGSLDLDLTTDEEKAEKEAQAKAKLAAQVASYQPVYFKTTSGEIAYSIYYVDDKYSSLKTYVYQGDKEKLLFTTYSSVFAGGNMPSSAKFTNCNWCSIYAIIEGNRTIIKNKPNSIAYEIIYKNDKFNLVSGSGTLTEQNYNSKLDVLCKLDSDGENFSTAYRSYTIEGYQLRKNQLMFVLAMIYMAGYEKNTVMD